MEKFARFARIAEIEFSDIVLSTQDLGHKLRIYLIDGTFIDFFYSTRLKTPRFAIHWERRHLDKTIYRLDNTPDQKWKQVKTFPLHFHSKEYQNVVVPPFNVSLDSLEETVRRFLGFVKDIVVG